MGRRLSGARASGDRDTDIQPGAEQTLRKRIALYWETLERTGLAPGASIRQAHFRTKHRRRGCDAQFVQENGPERIETKREIFQAMSVAAPSDTPLVSSSSFLLVSDFQQSARGPERVVLGHPFNPPHMVPLVEVAGGKQTSEEAIRAVMNFYAGIGKHPIRLKQEIFGHIANRLQTALWREAFHLIAAGVASAEDIDAAVTEGPGLRWAINGPCMVWHASGGAGGIRNTVAHMGPPTDAMVEDLYDGRLTAAVFQAVIVSTEAMVKGKDIDALTRYRDAGLLELLETRSMVRKTFASIPSHREKP